MTRTSPARRAVLLLALVATLAAGLGLAVAAPAQAAPPSNDNLANLTAINPVTGSLTLQTTTAEATLESGETGGGTNCNQIRNSVWFSYTAASSEPLTFETVGGATGFDSVLSVFTGSSATYPLTAVACNDEITNGNHLSRVGFVPTSGTTYYVQLANFSQPEPGDPGPGPVGLRLTVGGTSNDQIASAAPLAVDETLDVDTTLATKEAGEVGQDGCDRLFNTVWLKYTAPSDVIGTVTAETTLGGRDTVLNVWSGPPDSPQVTGLTPVGCNDDISPTAPYNRLSRVEFTPTPTTTYYLQVGTFGQSGSSGPGPLSVRLAVLPGPAPAHDQFSDPQVVEGATGSATGDTTLATREPGEPGSQNQGYTTWYAWTAPADGRYELETSPNGAGPVDTVLRVATGGSVGQLTVLAQNDDIDYNGGNLFSRLQFDAVAGTTYRVAVGGYRTDPDFPRGPFTLSWRVAPIVTTTDLAVDVDAQDVDLTATVSPTAATGSVQFFDGTTSVGTAPVTDGPTTLQLTDVAPGPHSYKAVFTPSGDAYLGSQSAAQDVTVDPIVTTTTITAVATGRRVELTADVVPASGTADAPGAVRFLDGERSLGNIAVEDGQATLTLPRVSAGTHTYVARYVSPTADYLGSTDQTTTTVAASPTTTSLGTAVSGQRVTLTSAVVAPDGTQPLAGSVEFFEGAASRGVVPLADGGAVLVLNGVAPGAHTYRAVFTSTDADVAGSTSPDRTATVAKLASRTTVTAPGTARAGARPRVTVTVKVGSASATGSVRVTLNGRTVATRPLAGGRVTVTLPALTAGRAKVVASYLGSSTATPSSATRTITVSRR